MVSEDQKKVRVSITLIIINTVATRLLPTGEPEGVSAAGGLMNQVRRLFLLVPCSGRCISMSTCGTSLNILR